MSAGKQALHTTHGNSRELGSRPMTRIDAARMLKRCLARRLGLLVVTRPTLSGLANSLDFLRKVAHSRERKTSSITTTNLYDWRQQVVLREDVERIRY